MKILLVAINAKYVHSSLAVGSIAAYNKAYSDSVEVAEYTINNTKSFITADIYKKNPDVVGVSCYIWNYSYVREIIGTLRKIMPDVPIWLGGPEVSYCSHTILEENASVTGIIRGEGEETWRELLEFYVDKKGQPANIAGITFRDGDKIISTPDREYLDPNKLVFCYDRIEEFDNRIIYYEGSRGCPYSCSYCLSCIDKRVRFKDLDKIKEELDFFIEKEVPQVKFTDRTFNCNHEYVKGIWKHLIEKDKGITNFHFEVSADLFDKEELDLISKMRPGLIQLEIGVQSTNPKTLSAINRKTPWDKLSANVRKIKSFGNTHQHLDLIAGLPFEGYESFARSFDDVYDLRPDQLQLGFLKILKGADICKGVEENEIVYMSEPPYEVLSNKYLSYSDILKIKLVEEMCEVYYNSSQFKASLIMLEEMYESPFNMFLELGEYYDNKGLLGINHSRMARYDILREFVSHKGFDVSAFEDVMLYDLYARENLKSRPAWAKEREDYSEFYRDEEHIRMYLGDYEAYRFKQVIRMTHMEKFRYDYSTWQEKSDYSTGEAILLFDYRTRSHIDNSARIVKVN
ncbi:MAG: DUF4080 domain-containing protein [Lachnospiraceae bacterium]|nr:DUF4080 domain-containing protein [Lachnospiraceae bacterium]